MNAKQQTPAKATKPKAPKVTKAQSAKVEKLFGKQEPEAKIETPASIAEDKRQGERRAADAMSFSLNQLSSPVSAPNAPVEAPKIVTPPAQLAEFQQELEALKAKFNITTPLKVAKAPKEAKLQQNGITRPAPTTTCGLIWRIADEISAETHGVAPIAAMKQHKSLAGVNDHTLKTQYARWRAFNNVKGRLPTIPAVHQTPGEYEGLSPLSKDFKEKAE